MDVGRENPNRHSHPHSKNFRDMGESRAIVDGNEANEPLFHQSRLLWSTSQLGHIDRHRREQKALPG